MQNPTFIYGTAWKEDRTEGCVTQALAAGFRAFDTANQRKHYFEEGVGKAVAEWLGAGNHRDSLFLQTKFTYLRGQDHRLPYDKEAPVPEQVQQSLASSLQHLGVEVLDSYVLHGPAEWASGRLVEQDHLAWRAMENAQASGDVRRLGVSNVDAGQLRDLLDLADTSPAFVQNRCYANRGWDEEVREICAEAGVVYQGFSLLTANRDVWNHPLVAAIAKTHGCLPAQVLFGFASTLDILPLTGTTDPSHMAAALRSGTVQLSDEERTTLAKLGRE